MNEIGPHLLGRLRSTPDARDFTVDMVKEATTLELAFQRMLAARGANPAVKDWAGEVMKRLEGLDPAPAPAPPGPAEGTNFAWGLNDPVLDQMATPHCGGFGGCHWGNVAPIEDHFTNDDGHDLYYDAVKIGTGGRNEEGVESRWVAKALQAWGRLETYAFAQTTEEITEWLRTRGPVMVGTDWTTAMFSPKANGYVKPTGDVEGGHFWLLVGHEPEQQFETYLALNSWGESWGLDGYFRITVADFALLLKGLTPQFPGDAIVSPELAV